MPDFVLTPEPPVTEPIVVLDPVEVATADRKELNLELDGLKIAEEGCDFGDAEIVAFMAEQQTGEAMIDYRLPNRVIKIPLIVSAGEVTSFDDVRVKLQAKCSRINEDGGWLKYTLPSGRYLFADLVNAKLHLSANWLTANRDIDRAAMLEFQALPDFYGDPTEEEPFEGTGDASETFQIKGNLPGRVESLTVTDKSGNDQLGLGWAFRCRNYSADESAAWTYEAEDLTPLDQATISTLSGASPSGSAANNTVLHNNLSTNWTPVLSTNRLPKVRGVAAAKASTGAITPALPTGVLENDILLMFIETENQAVTVPAGWAHVSGSPVEVASGTTTRLTVLWKRAGASEAAPTVADPGDHIIARIMAVSGCIKTGNPWNTTKTETELVSDTSVSVPTATTTVDSCLVLAAVATGTDVSSSAHASAWANANLQAVTEQMDSWTAEGAGGGFSVASGIKLKAGAIGATTATVGTANFKALMTIALKPETGGNFLTHTGTYDVWARVYTTSEEAPWLRLIFDVGDIVAPSENMQVCIPGSDNLYLVNLGQINLQRIPFGEHRWQGAVQARGEKGGENISVDRLEFFCADECSGIMTASLFYGIGLNGYTARDNFNQPVGALNGKALDIGGNWTTGGSVKSDFQESGTGFVTRNAKEDIEERWARSPASELSVVAARMSWKLSALPKAGKLTVGLEFGNLEASMRAKIEGSAKELRFFGKFIDYDWQPETLYTFTIFVMGNKFAAGWITAGGNPPSVEPTITSNYTGGLAKAKLQIGDLYEGKESITRTYENFEMWVPDLDAVIFANRNANLSTQGMFRQSEDGTGDGPVAYPGADLPRIPVSGPEERPVEIVLQPSQGDFGEVPDSGLGKAAAQLAYRPAFSYVPSS